MNKFVFSNCYTLLFYIPQKRKNVLPALSVLFYDSVDGQFGDKKKSETAFYNDMKYGVDTLNKMCSITIEHAIQKDSLR